MSDDVSISDDDLSSEDMDKRRDDEEEEIIEEDEEPVVIEEGGSVPATSVTTVASPAITNNQTKSYASKNLSTMSPGGPYQQNNNYNYNNNNNNSTIISRPPVPQTGIYAIRPIFRGRYTRKGDDSCTWEGKWGMMMKDFNGGIVSNFKYTCSIPKSYIANPYNLDSSLHHPALLAYDCTEGRQRPPKVSDFDCEKINPIFINYARGRTMLKTFPPVTSSYNGAFFIKTMNPDPMRAPVDAKNAESNLKFAFFQNGIYFSFNGTGRNNLGWFTLTGRFNPGDGSLIATKAYVPYEPESPYPSYLNPDMSKFKAKNSRTPSKTYNTTKSKKTPIMKTPRPPTIMHSSTPTLSSMGTPIVMTSFGNPEDSGGGRTGRKTKLPSYLSESHIVGTPSSINRHMEQLMENLMKHQGSIYFNVPVDPVALGIPDYPTIVKNPMDFGTILSNIKSGAYTGVAALETDVALVFSNCRLYNPKGNVVNQACDFVEKDFNTRLKTLKRTIGSEQRQSIHAININDNILTSADVDDDRDEDYEYEHDEDYPIIDKKTPARRPSVASNYGSSRKFGSSSSVHSGASRKRPRNDADSYYMPAPAPVVMQGGVDATLDIKKIASDVAMQVSQQLKVQHDREVKLLKAQMADMQMRLINVNAQVNNQSYTNAASFAPPITSTRAKSAGGGGAAFGGGGGGPRGRSNLSQPLSYEDKKELSASIGRLNEDQVEKVLAIIQEHSNLADGAEDEIELDMEALDTTTLRALQKYVKSCATSGKRKRSDDNNNVSKKAKAEIILNNAQKQIDDLERGMSGSIANGSANMPLGGVSDSDSEAADDSEEDNGTPGY